ncbi:MULTISPECIES: helix-turn-helix domain-containing protein [unclassified Streptomyces]|uniref:helix-turn-helix domain-containing protein n=1 Tax=unclassified Streptomyces TaxID=2593676 RepID=UPI001F3F547A|nr:MULTISPECIES: helix-turn-helix domain-containing protein [unclassified Streptomyces]
MSLDARYAAKAAELGVTDRTIRRWVADYRRHGEAGLVQRASSQARLFGRADDRWVETALEVMVELTGESKPSRKMVIDRTRARLIARFGPDVVPQPSPAQPSPAKPRHTGCSWSWSGVTHCSGSAPSGTGTSPTGRTALMASCGRPGQASTC